MNKFVGMLCSIFLVASCANRPSQYTVDPDVAVNQLKHSVGKTFTINVVAPEQPQPTNSESSITYLNAANDFSDTVKKNVINALAQKGYRISSNKHFTDYFMTLDFQKLEVKVEKGNVSDEIKVKGELSVTIIQKPHSIKKSFSRNQTLTVALRAEQAEVTGITNQVVGELLNRAFNDEELIAFLTKHG